MAIIDTHIHTSPYWYEPIEVILFQMDRNKVDRATLVQYRGQTDNSYMIECARRFPGRFCPIVIVDTEDENAIGTLRQLAKNGAGGVRLKPTTRSPGKDPLAMWRACAQLKLPISCGGTKQQFASDEFRKVVSELPDVTIIIEHLGSVGRDEMPPYDTFRKILKLAEYPNVFIKAGGLGEICDRPQPFRQPFPFENVPPFVEMVFNAFGPSRMMWGSNYPPSSPKEGYGNTLHYMDEHLSAFCDEKSKREIFGGTALSLFGFSSKSTGKGIGL
jgi:L-fuconolactonase